MTRFEEILAATKINDLIQKKDDEDIKKTVLWILAIVGAIAAIAGIAYAVYRFVTPGYLEDFEDDFDDDFEDEFLADEDDAEA